MGRIPESYRSTGCTSLAPANVSQVRFYYADLTRQTLDRLTRTSKSSLGPGLAEGHSTP
jgi:hypothetical protein